MISPYKVESLESSPIRLAPYIGELQEFLSTSGHHFGSPNDLAPLALLLSVPGIFHDEMASMIRSIIYRERGTVPHTDLLALVTVAIGGPHVIQTSEELHEPVGRLLKFVSGVLRAQRSSVSEPSRLQGGVETSVSASSTEVQSYGQETEVAAVQPSAHVQSEASLMQGSAAASGAADRASSTVYSRASTISSNPQEWDVVQARVPSESVDSVDSMAPVDSVDSTAPTDRLSPEEAEYRVSPQPPSSPVTRNTFLWAFGIGLMLLFVSINRYLDHHHAAPAEGQTSAGPAAGLLPSMTLNTGAAHRPAAAASQAAIAPGGTNSATASDKARWSGSAPSEQLTGPLTSPVVPTVPGVLADRESASATSSAITPALDPEVAHMGSLGATPSGRAARFDRSTRQGSFAISSGVMASNLISAPSPEYPKLASFAHIQGQVILQVVVSRNGKVVDTHIIRGPRLLRGAATDAVRRWRYRPYVLNGKATDVATIVTVDFRLHH